MFDFDYWNQIAIEMAVETAYVGFVFGLLYWSSLYM